MKVEIWTDGACPGNPGPMGIGVVMRVNGNEQLRTISRNLGYGTNNQAEILAVIHALRNLPCKIEEAEVTLHTDSQLIHGWLMLGWKVKANRELVGEMKCLAALCKSFKVVKVKGHAGDRHNELADHLARQAPEGN